MAFKMTKDDLSKRGEVAGDAYGKQNALQSAIDKYNDALEPLRGAVEEAWQAYADSLEQLAEFVSGLAADARNEFEERSEKWVEGEKGQQAEDWISGLEQMSFEAPEIEFPEPIEVDFGAVIEEVEEYSTEA